MSHVSQKRRWQLRRRCGMPTAHQLRAERRRARREAQCIELLWWPAWAPLWFQQLKWWWQLRSSR